MMDDAGEAKIQSSSRLYPAALALLAMLVASAMGFIMAPRNIVENSTTKLRDVIPLTFADWSQVVTGPQQVSLLATDENGNDPMQIAYDDSLLRTYVRPGSREIMLAIAYDRVQREENRVHRPEICYIAQGFKIVFDRAALFPIASHGRPTIEGRQMLAVRGNRWEAVSFWIRLGDTFSQNPWQSRSYVITEGLAGRLHDGLLLRTSEIISSSGEADASFRRQEVFMNDLLSNLAPPALAQLIAATKGSSVLRSPT